MTKLQFYKVLIDRGWRRSGSYLYQPELQDSCCRQYAIRLDAAEFHPDRHCRNALNRLNAYVVGADRAYSPQGGVFDFEAAVQCAQSSSSRLEVKLAAPIFTDEKFRVFKAYQTIVHHEDPMEVTERGFQRFLCDSPIRREESQAFQIEYGLWHHEYRFDGALFAVGVLDILPGCISSVYFFYNPEQWNRFSVGRIGACYEISLTRKLGLSHYYMGLYIYSCPKMKYKGEYKPSYLLDPESLNWHPLQDYVDEWRRTQDRYITLDGGSNVEGNVEDADIKRVKVVVHAKVIPAAIVVELIPELAQDIRNMLMHVGKDEAPRIALHV